MGTYKTDVPVAAIESFAVTGIDRKGKRFKKTFTAGENRRTAYESAMMTNVYQGSVWVNLIGGKRKLLKRVWN